MDTVKHLLRRQLVNVNTTYRGASLLCHAVSRADVDMTRVLCHAGADVNTSYTWQNCTETPLIAAVRLGFENIAQVLLETPGIKINLCDSHGKSGIH